MALETHPHPNLAGLIEGNSAGVVAVGATPDESLAPALLWDGYGLMRPASGIYAHAMGLATALKAQGLVPTIVAPGGICPGFEAWPQWTVHGPGTKLKFVWPWRTARALNAALSKRPVVYHGLSNFNVPYGKGPKGLRRILTVHDLIPLRDDGGVGPALRLQMQWLMGRAVASADQIVCVSEWTRRTLVEKWPKCEARCVVIGNGVANRTVESTANERRSLAPTVLSVARGERYKDLPMVAVIARRSPAAWRFRVVTDRRGADLLRREGREVVDAGRLVILQNLPETALRAEFRRAHAYLQTSWYEGFCLPALDALKVATPVVYRKGSGMDEVVGDDGGIGIRPPAGLERTAIADLWVEAVQAALVQSEDSGFADRAAARLRKVSTWSEAGAALVRLYSV